MGLSRKYALCETSGLVAFEESMWGMESEHNPELNNNSNMRPRMLQS